MRPVPRSTTPNAEPFSAMLTDYNIPSTTASALPLARSVSVMECETGIALVRPRGRGSSTAKKLKSTCPPTAAPAL